MQLLDRLSEHYIPTGSDYRELLSAIHRHLVPRTYVEIGVSTGRTLALALPGTRCVGIDPDPANAYRLARGTTIYAETSDDFFASHVLSRELGDRPVDLAFIDGLHLFEFALRDFMNLERAAHRDTTVLIHDCLPLDEVTAARERTTAVWTGDVWRLIVALRHWRPDLQVSVIDRAPTGLALVTGLDPNSTVLADNYEAIVGQFLDMPYSGLDDGTMDEQLNRVDGDWPTVQGLLPDRRFRHTSADVLKARWTLAAAGRGSVLVVKAHWRRAVRRVRRAVAATR